MYSIQYVYTYTLTHIHIKILNEHEKKNGKEGSEP